jgi:hypothetical protein
MVYYYLELVYNTNMDKTDKTIEDIIKLLNDSTPGQIWAVLDGIYAITTVKNNGDNGIEFNPANGIVIKTFINQITGEIKMFPAKLLGFPGNLNI